VVNAMAAIPLFDRAARTALGAGDDVGFVEAYAREILAISISARTELPPGTADALGALPLAEQIAVRSGPAAAFARALLFNNAGVARRSAGDNAGARAWFEKALTEPRTREGDVELASAYGNLALVTAEPARRDALLATELALRQRLVGPDHVMTLDAELKATIYIGNPAKAVAALRAVCDRYQRLHPITARSRINLCSYQLGWLAEERGDITQARVAFDAIPASNGQHARVARAYRSWLAGDLAQAIHEADSAAAALQGEWWTRIYAVDALVVAAQVQVALGHPRDAIARLRRALTWLEQLAEVESGADRPRRLARIRGQLARLEAAHDRAAAHSEARDAAAWYRQVGGYDRQAEELEAIARATAGTSTSGSR